MKGQWATVQNTLEVEKDKQVRANSYIVLVTTHDGHDFELVASPVLQFDEKTTFEGGGR